MNERVRLALIECALAAYEDARIQGLCCEGAFEAAVSAMRTLDLGAAGGIAGEGALEPETRGGTQRTR